MKLVRDLPQPPIWIVYNRYIIYINIHILKRRASQCLIPYIQNLSLPEVFNYYSKLLPSLRLPPISCELKNAMKVFL